MAWPFSKPAPQSERREPYLANIQNPNTPITPEELGEIFMGGPTTAGPHVSARSAFRAADVFRCVAILSGIIAALDLNVYEKTQGGDRKEAEANRMWPILHDAPNDYMSSFVWRELLMVHLLTQGNHYSVIEYDGAGRVYDLIPVIPESVTASRVGRRIQYRIDLLDGPEFVDQDDMLHIPGMGFDGLKGLPVIEAVGRQTIGTALAMEEATARLHSNGTRPSGVGKAAPGMSPAAFKRMRAQFDSNYTGVGNTAKTLWLDAGSEWTQSQITPVDAETLASRRWQTAQMANIFGVPAMLLNENADMTAWGAGIEQIMLGFQMTTINPWLRRIEQEFQRKLFRGTRLFAAFDREGLIIMDSKARADLFSKLITSSILRPNEARKKMNLPRDPSPNAEKLLIQGAMIPLDQAGQATSPQPQPTTT